MGDIAEKEYINLDEASKYINKEYNNKNLLIFANNSSGKTTISRKIEKIKGAEKCLCFNTFIEESFTWNSDKENDEFSIDVNNELIYDAIVTQGIESKITQKFISLIGSRVGPNFEELSFSHMKVTFSIVTGDERKEDSIKISRGEESIFIWSVFLEILNMVIDESGNEGSDYRSIEYVIIDDPVNSLSEEKINSVACGIADIMNKKSNFKFLVMTHNRQLYNVIASRCKSKLKTLRLFRKMSGFSLKEINSSPFGYHLEEIKTIKNAIETDNIEKIHFNMFRNILERTATFLGYGGKWSQCLSSRDKNTEFAQSLNNYSHSSVLELDDKKIYNEDEKDMFREFFFDFCRDYKWKVDNDDN